ncbi:MAG TPA: MarP family serine protease [Streptosporangiaceae bacterium]
MPGDLLDVILIVLAAAFAVAGYRQGFIIGMMSLAGFVGGVLLGAVFAPGLSRALANSLNLQAVLALLVVFVSGIIGMAVLSGIGVAIRSRVRWRPATVLDSLGGAAVNIVALLLVAWLIGSFVAEPLFPAVSRQVTNSAVLRGVDKLMPSAALGQQFSPLRSLFNSGAFPQVFGALGAESALNVAPPSQAVLRSQGLAMARVSVVKIDGLAPSCSKTIEGSGFVIAPDRVLTNAHVVAGVTEQLHAVTDTGTSLTAHVVLYDPRRDIAVLDVPGLSAPPLAFASQAKVGASAIVAGYPLNHSFTAVAARVGRAETATGPDIYQTATVRRQIYAIRAVVEPGNSGGPLLTPDGRVYGVVFAASVAVPDTGYALTGAEVAPDVHRGVRQSAPVSTQRCG